MEEFGFDLIQIADNGLPYRNGGDKVEDYICFGKAVLAVAEGYVVRTLDGVDDDNSFLRQKNETENEYDIRMRKIQTDLLLNRIQEIAGNYVVIRHPGDEYSMYLHLKNGSVMVKPGDKVQQGQIVGRVGHSGNSTGPHLHFQLCAGEDILNSRGLPIIFSNISRLDEDFSQYIQSGDLIATIEKRKD